VLAANTKPCTIRLHRFGLLGDLAELGVLVNLKENTIVLLATQQEATGHRWNELQGGAMLPGPAETSLPLS